MGVLEPPFFMKKITTTKGNTYEVGDFKGRHIEQAAELAKMDKGGSMQIAMLATAGVNRIEPDGTSKSFFYDELMDMDGVEVLELIAEMLGK